MAIKVAPRGERARAPSRIVSAQWIIPVLILVLAFALRSYHLGDKSLWGDEIAQVRRSSIALTRILDEYREPPRFFLQFVLIHLTREIGTSDFWMRLPSAFASVLGVASVYPLARRIAGLTVARVTMLFMALAPFQIWYAQDARMYGALTWYAILALYFFTRLLTRPNWQAAAGLILASALLAYNHLFGFLVLLTLVVIAAVLAAQDWFARRGKASAAGNIPGFRAVILCMVIVAALVLPLLPGTLPFVWRSGLRDASVEWRALPPFQLSPAFLSELFGYFGLSAGADWRMWLSLGIALSGLAVLFRRDARQGLLTLLWVAVPLAVLGLARPRHEVVPRYLIFIQPVYLLWLAQGAVAGYAFLMSRVARWTRDRKKIQRGARYIGAALCIAGLSVMIAPPLASLYRRAKINDWRAVSAYLSANARPGDFVTAERGAWALRALTYYWPQQGKNRVRDESLEQMQQALARGQTVWYLSLGGWFDAEGENWAREYLTPLAPSIWQRSDLDYTQRDEFVFPQSEGYVTIYRSAAPAEK